jgi:hypothetical protein
VRSYLGSEFTSFKKTPFSESETDAFDGLGLHLYYDANDKLEFIEAFSPCQIVFQGVELIGESTLSVVDQLSAQGLSARLDESTYFYDDHGIVIMDDGGLIEGVSLFARGYYD